MNYETEKRLEDVLLRVAIDDKNKKDVHLMMNEIRMQPDGKIKRMGIGSWELELSDHAQTQIFSRLGMPVRYMKKMLLEQPMLVALHFNYWAGKAKDMGVLLRTRQDENIGIVRGVLSEKYSKLDNKDVMGSLVEIIKNIPNAEVHSFYMDDKRTHLRLLIPELTANLGIAKTGEEDIVKVGLDLINSEVGASSLVISPMVFRLVCSNGLRAWTVDGDIFRQRHIHLTHQELFLRMNEAIVDSIKQGDELLQVLNATKEFEITNPLEIIEELATKNLYSQKIVDKAKENYLIEPDKNLYGVVNALTRTARDLENEPRLDLEKFAGRVMTDRKMVQNAQKAITKNTMTMN